MHTLMNHSSHFSVRSPRFHSFQVSLLAALGIAVLIPSHIEAEQTSELWGKEGEKWTPESRLPDFSQAGYRRGEEPYRIPTDAISVKDFGATGDGQADDTEAFKKAIAAGPDKLILIPKGRYILSDILEITQPRIVLRGEGAEATVLLFTRPLQEINPKTARTGGFGANGRDTTPYSWGGGLIRVTGDSPEIGGGIAVANEATRGASQLTLESHDFKAGDEIVISLKDDTEKSLLAHLYRGQGVDISPQFSKTIKQVFRITAVNGNEISLDRALRFDVKSTWNPVVRMFSPHVTDVGIEELGFEFPATPYVGHWDEVGFNPIEFAPSVAHCWARNLRIRNADSGPFVHGWFCSLDGLTLDADRKRALKNGISGHHGLSLFGNDGLCTNYVIETKFFHDNGLSGGSVGNVFSRGKGEDINMDHHKYAPYENLFTDLDVGEGTRLFESGGGGGAGNHSAAGATFWNIRSKEDAEWPEAFQLDFLNLVALKMRGGSTRDLNGRWIEAIRPGTIAPPDLHWAMLQKRLAAQGRSSGESPSASGANSAPALQSWKSAEGQVIEAQFEGLQGDQVTLIRDGKSFTFPLERLSAESQELARKLAKGQ